jgi:hypothetical protein
MRRSAYVAIIAGILASPCAAQLQDWYTNGWMYSARVSVDIRNVSSDERPNEPVVLSVADLQRRARDFNPRCFVVVDPSAEPDHERELGGNDIPSQADDLDGDGLVDEIAFEVGLGRRETKRVLVYYEPGDASRPIDYVPQTYAHVSPRYEGPGWESKLVAYRLYLDYRNAIDVFGKTEPGLSLSTYATPGYDYHELTDAGVDVLHIGDALGVGGFALWRDNGLVRPEICVRSTRVIASGPVRAIVEVAYLHWPAGVGGREADVTSRFTIWANHRWSEHSVVVDGLRDFRLATGIPKIERPGAPTVRTVRGRGYLGTWGAQSDAGEDLGLGVIYRTSDLATTAEDDLNHLLLFKGIATRPVTWWLVAAWEKESDPVTSVSGFASMLQHLESRLSTPVNITIGSGTGWLAP